MRLVRVGDVGRERPGVLVDDDRWVDVSAHVHDWGGDLLGDDHLARVASVVGDAVGRGDVLPLDGLRIGAPIARPHQILCIGLNYGDHARETGQEVPSEPIVFTKSPNTLVGPTDDVRSPRASTHLDWEVELGVVVGTRCRYLEDEAAAHRCIAGYLVVNDVSERQWQLERGGQWLKGKSAETFNPAGPWLATRDEFGDTDDLEMWLNVNGKARQRGSTRTMLFRPEHVVYYLSQFMVLEPGDLINTGTPPGVGMGMRPPTYLRIGDVVELGIDRLGAQRQRVVAHDGRAVSDAGGPAPSS